MIKLDLTYVGRSQGEYEGRNYDSVALSDGIRTYKFKTPEGSNFTGLIEEKDKVTCTMKLQNGQNGACVLKLVDFKKI